MTGFHRIPTVMFNITVINISILKHWMVNKYEMGTQAKCYRNPAEVGLSLDREFRLSFRTNRTGNSSQAQEGKTGLGLASVQHKHGNQRRKRPRRRNPVWDAARLVGCLSSTHNALGSISNTTSA